MACIKDGSSLKDKELAMLNDYNTSEVIGLTSYILARFEGKLIKEGSGNNGNILANLEGDLIREGHSTNGRIMAVIIGDEIREVGIEGQLLFKIEGIASKIEKAALAVAAFMLKGQI
jgi:hypothetical protein